MGRVKKYIAKTGIDFEQFDPPIHVDAGNPIPDKLDQEAIEDLLAIGAIQEVEK